jgi:multiple sugar transport system permease protein/sn-glycerol 3-phosphate transport system permease protein
VKGLTAYLYILPAVGLLCLFTYWPILFSFILSFFRTDLLSGSMTFVGLTNYAELLRDASFTNALRVTFLFTLITVPARLALALALAHVLRRGSRPVRFLRGAYFLPYVTSSVAVSVIWSWMFNTDMGVVNFGLGALGFERVPWLQSPTAALWAVAIVAIWKQLGYDILLYVAGLNAIPQEYYEAARIDGARPKRLFTSITWPLVAPTTVFLLVVSVIDSFQVFTIVNVMTFGGPAEGTNVLMNHLYYLSFILFDISKGSTLAVVLFLFLAVVTAVKLTVAGGRVSHEYA